jgi:hypothetical protein
MRSPSFVWMIFISRRHIGKRCARFFFLLPPSRSLAHWVRNIATYDTFLDGFLESILSSLAHSVTIEALWWYVAVPKRLQRWLGAMYISPSDENEKLSRNQPKTHNRRSARGEHHACSQLIVYQKKIQASTNG